MRLIVTGIIIGLLFTNCNSPKTTQQELFNTIDFFNNQVKILTQQELMLHKVLAFNNQTDTVVNTKPNWKEELAPFFELDLNKPAYAGRFTIKNMANQTTYNALDSATNIKQVVITFNANQQVESIAFALSEKNNLYQSTKQLVYHTKKGYEITGMQQAKLQQAHVYTVNANFITP